MIKYVRSFFGLSSERKVIGSNISLDFKDVELVRNSNSRLSALQNLITRYKNTSHEAQIKTVFEKTKNIHHYLVNKKRIQELELFHLQNTDHFISTFNVIMDVYKSPKESSTSQERPEIIDIVNKKRESKRFTERPIGKPGGSQAKTSTVYEPAATKTESATSDKPTLQVPDITLHTFSKIPYTRKSINEIQERQIGFFSTKEDKEAFLQEVAAQLNLAISDLAYVGNALVDIPDENIIYKQLEYVPVIHWKGFMYAVNLKDFRLFPVTMQRKSL